MRERGLALDCARAAGWWSRCWHQNVLRRPVGTASWSSWTTISCTAVRWTFRPTIPSSRMPTTFAKNRDRLQAGAVFAKFTSKLLNHPEVKPLLSDEHFSVDGTLIPAWASWQEFPP